MAQRGRDKKMFPLRDIGDFLGAQAIVVSPLLYLTYLRLLGRMRLDGAERGKDSWLYSVLLCVVTIVTAFVSLHNKVEGNWAVAPTSLGSF